MADTTEISWTDSTWNPWTGCTKVSPGCDGCYAESWSKRAGAKVGKWGPGAQRVRTTPANWRKPLIWNAEPFAQCPGCGWRDESREATGDRLVLCPRCLEPAVDARRRVFCASLADVFDHEVPRLWRTDLFRLLRSTPNLDWLLLTKRIGNAGRMISDALTDLGESHLEWPWPNVWLGATIVNQEEADRDIPKLLATPARVRFLSMEPLLGPVDLTDLVQRSGGGEHHFSALDCDVDPADDDWGGATVDWVIAGGESGPHARPMHPDWVRSLRDQCATAGVPFHLKQICERGRKLPMEQWPEDLRLPQAFPEVLR